MARIKVDTDDDGKRRAIVNRIKEVARAQMREEGSASISLRAIARELDITAPALYRYYPDRDALITDLIVDAFNALADAVEAAEQAQPPADYAERMYAAINAYRTWAVEHPTDFLLIYGTPIPGYVAPREQTVPAVQRTFVPFVRILFEADQAGVLTLPAEDEVDDPAMRAHFEALARTDDVPISYRQVSIAIDVWHRLYGLIMLQILAHSPATVGDVEAYYRLKVRHMLKDMNLLPENFE